GKSPAAVRVSPAGALRLRDARHDRRHLTFGASRYDRPMGDVETAIRCLDLTSLRGDETDDDIARLCERGARHEVASVVVYPERVAAAKRHLRGTVVKVATVGGDFPG